MPQTLAEHISFHDVDICEEHGLVIFVECPPVRICLMSSYGWYVLIYLLFTGSLPELDCWLP